MNNWTEQAREEFNEKFPPPMLLGQNQEQVANFWIAKHNQYIAELRGEIEKLKKVSDSNTYLYGQGQSLAYEKILALLSAPNDK